MRWLIVCLISSFLVTVSTAEECAPCDCIWNWRKLLTVDCTAHRHTHLKNLTEIPDTINKNANELHFYGQSFTILKNNTFATFHNLTMINFGFNKIEIIERQTFKNLTTLSDLWLSNNNIHSLSDGIFHDLRQILIIDLSHNNITELPKNIFSNLSTLLKLWIYDNKIKTLPDGILHDLRQIEVISISGNSITELHKNLFFNLSTLNHLALHNNKIKALPVEIFHDLQKIENIHLDNNNITKLQKYLFYNLTRISNIHISNNKINTIEKESFSKVPNLKTVELRNNELKKLQIDIIDNVRQIKYFDLTANPWHCDEDLCAVMDSNPHDDPRYFLDTPTCQTPEKLKGKGWTQLLDSFIPHISNNSQNVEEGHTAYLECKCCFSSKIIWKFNNKRISRDHSVDISETSLTSTLTLSNVTEDDAGYYSCQVQDCATCAVAGTYLKVNYRTSDDKTYTVPDLVPTTSLVTPATEVPGDKKTHSSFSLYLILTVTLLIILIATGISIFYCQKYRKNKIQQKQETEFKYSHRRGSDPVSSPPQEPGWGFTPRTHRTIDQSNSDQATNNHTSSNTTTNAQTTSNNRRNEHTLRDETNNETASDNSKNEQLTSDDGRTDDTAYLLPVESVE